MLNNPSFINNNFDQQTNVKAENVSEWHLKAQYLVTQNPFLIEEDIEEIKKIITLNDFLVDDKKGKISLNDLINSNYHSPFLKRRIIKNQFYHWKNEYYTKEKDFLKRINNQKEVMKNLDYNRFSKITLIIYLFIFLVLVILLYQPKLFYQSTWLYNLLIKSWELFNQNSLLNLLGLSLFGFLFFTISFGCYQNIVLKTYHKRHKISKHRMKDLEKSLKVHFRKQYKKTRQHYLKAVSGKSLPPVELNDLIKPELHFQQVDIVNQLALEDASRFKRSNRLFKLKRFLVHAISIILSLTFIILLIINLT